MNLLNETLKKLQSVGKTPRDVRWIGDGKAVGTWEDFEKLANFEYNDGFGSAEISSVLKIVGDDWWLERAEYDGSEWWEFKNLPTPQASTTVLCADALRELC